TDLAFLVTRIWLRGTHAAEGDLRRASALNPGDDRLRALLDVLARSGYLLAGLDTLADLAATLRACITAADEPSLDTASLDPLLPALFLAPRWGLRSASRMLLRVLSAHTDSVKVLAFSPDGRRLASGSDDATVRLWNPETGAELALLHTGSVRAL